MNTFLSQFPVEMQKRMIRFTLLNAGLTKFRWNWPECFIHPFAEVDGLVAQGLDTSFSVGNYLEILELEVSLSPTVAVASFFGAFRSSYLSQMGVNTDQYVRILSEEVVRRLVPAGVFWGPNLSNAVISQVSKITGIECEIDPDTEPDMFSPSEKLKAAIVAEVSTSPLSRNGYIISRFALQACPGKENAKRAIDVLSKSVSFDLEEAKIELEGVFKFTHQKVMETYHDLATETLYSYSDSTRTSPFFWAMVLSSLYNSQKGAGVTDLGPFDWLLNVCDGFLRIQFPGELTAGLGVLIQKFESGDGLALFGGPFYLHESFRNQERVAEIIAGLLISYFPETDRDKILKLASRVILAYGKEEVN